MSKAFARVMAYLTSFQSLSWAEQASAAPYRSRGHGQGKYSGKKQANPLGKYMPHQGEKEKARRVGQMKAAYVKAKGW